MGRIPQPVVCGVNGPAVGGGMSLALAGDLRIGSKQKARFLPTFVKLGLGGAQGGHTSVGGTMGSPQGEDGTRTHEYHEWIRIIVPIRYNYTYMIRSGWDNPYIFVFREAGATFE